MSSSCESLVWLALLYAVVGSVAGCGGATGAVSGGSDGGYTPPVGSFAGLGFSGTVLTGTQPVQAAGIQIYAAGTAGNGSAPTQLLAAAVSTDTSGAFHVAAGSYTCPAGDSIFYVVATGGSLGGGAANSARNLGTVPGTCNSLGSGAAFVLNEVTTAATAYALRPFLSSGGQLGSSSTNLQGLTSGAAMLARLVNLAAGTAPGTGFPGNGTAPLAKLNTVANILYACSGAAASNASGCASLFSATAADSVSPQNTFEAAISLANHPEDQLVTPPSSSSAFSPALTAAPPDWTLAIPFTGGGMNGPTSVSVDSTGNVWVANYFGVASLFANSGAPLAASGITGYELQESYGGAVDATDRMWVANEEDSDYTVNNGMGSVTVLNASGPALPGNSAYAAGGLDFPISLAFDRSGTAWIVNYGNSRLTVLNSAGAAQSGAQGYVSDQFAFPVAVATDPVGAAWIANQSASTVTQVTPNGAAFTSYTVGAGPSAVAVDAVSNVWTANYYGDSVGLVSAAGKVLSSGGFTGAGLNHPTGIAADGAGSVWVANYRAPGVSALAGATAAVPGAPLSGLAGWGSELAMTEPFGIAVDSAGNVWVTSYGDNRLVEIVGAATPVKTPLLGGVRVP